MGLQVTNLSQVIYLPWFQGMKHLSLTSGNGQHSQENRHTRGSAWRLSIYPTHRCSIRMKGIKPEAHGFWERDPRAK
jgi:hypothetical protein